MTCCGAGVAGDTAGPAAVPPPEQPAVTATTEPSAAAARKDVRRGRDDDTMTSDCAPADPARPTVGSEALNFPGSEEYAPLLAACVDIDRHYGTSPLMYSPYAMP